VRVALGGADDDEWLAHDPSLPDAPRHRHGTPGRVHRDGHHADDTLAVVIVDVAVYEDGKRLDGIRTPDDARRAAEQSRDRFVWIGLSDPSEAELALITDVYELHPLAVEDALHAHQRPKLESYEGDLFVVLKTVVYVDRHDVLDFGELMFFIGPRHVITVRHGLGCDLPGLRRELEQDPERLAMGPAEVLHRVVDHVVDNYEVAATALEEDIDELQVAVFSGPSSTHAERIFRLKREVLEFRQSVVPLEAPMSELAHARFAVVPEDRRPYFQNVHDHVARVAGRLDTINALLDGALHANVAQVGMRQNEDMRKITAWVAIAAVPTMIAGIYGMNFEHMPELDWQYGYPLALAVIATVCTGLYRRFKRRGWL
jgi:magnesium transporter